MQTVLITGNSGFTGQYMSALLKKEDFNVVGLSHSDHVKAGDIGCDLSDLATLKQIIAKVQPTYVIHLAALSFVAEQNQEAFYSINILGTQNLLEALFTLKKLPEKILIPSTANVYGLIKQDRLKETLCPAPVNHYGMSKLAMEHMAATWFHRLPIIITRPFNYTGPHQNSRFLVPKIVSHFQQKKTAIELGSLDVIRDFSDVRDVVQIYKELLQSNIVSEKINICSGEGVALREIIEYMNKLADYSIEVKTNPDFIRNNEIARLIGDNSKLKKLLNFSPQFHLEKTLRDMYENPI